LKDVARIADRAGSEGIPVDLEVTPPIAADRREDIRPRNDHLNGVASSGARLAPARPIASPVIRAQAREAGIDLRLVSGSGAAGRITHDDLAGYVRGWSKGTGAKGTGGSRIAPRNDAVEEIKVVGLRRRIAERMAESTRRVAHFSYIEEVDVTALDECRQQLNARFADSRPKLTVLPFVVAALVLAVRDFPQVNGTYDDDKEVVSRHDAVHVGIATQTPSGLMVPVLFHAEALDLWRCADEIKRLATAVRQGSASREELSGSTITITSLGDLGGVATTPIINRPELAIIGVNRMTVRPVWRDGQFVPRVMMNLSSSFDHRIIDGYEAAQFIRRMKDLLEAPALLLVGT
jgi:2-oxoisovalerate dehydrogenase E2 component (dihydrolipoyl transacylase)